MNIHPFLVHFPIAFLSVYGFMELVRIKYITSAIYWFYIKASLVIIGSAGAVVAYLSGEAAEEFFGETRLIETHSQWAEIATIIFGSIAGLYVIVWLIRLEVFNRFENSLNLNNLQAYRIIKSTTNYVVNSFIMILPASVGLISIVITGALGGAIVYGPDIDPFVRFIYDMVMGF